MIEAFRQGRMPDNKQIDDTLQYVKATSPVDVNQLSSEGRKLIQDARDIIETARVMVQEKNADELFQNFVWHTRDVDVTQAKKDPNDVLPVDKIKVKDDSQRGAVLKIFLTKHNQSNKIVVFPAVQHLRTILSLILTNSEVRKLLSDFSLIGRDLLARGASEAADRLRPDQQALSHVDETAPQDQFATEGGRTVGPNETPVLEVKVPGTGYTITQHSKDDIGTGATVETENGNQKTVLEEGQKRWRQVKEQGQGAASELMVDIHQCVDILSCCDASGPYIALRQANGIREGEDPEGKKRGLLDKVKGMRDGLSDRIPQQHKEKASDHIARGKQFLTEEYFPEERRDQFIYRAKKVYMSHCISRSISLKFRS